MAARYRDLSITEKRAVAIAGVREPSVPCPAGCGMSLMPVDLLSHLARRCKGRPEPGPSAKWVSHAEALKIGVTRKKLWQWCRPDRYGWIAVRVRVADDGFRRYLLGDLQCALARRKAGSVGRFQTETGEVLEPKGDE
jgi:hypothetical protein